MLSERDWLIACFYRIIAVNRRVNPRIGARKAFSSARLGIFLDKRVGFAGWGWPSVGVMAVIVAAALRIHTDGNAGGDFVPTLLGRGIGWGNDGVGTLAVGFVSEADAGSALPFFHPGVPALNPLTCFDNLQRPIFNNVLTDFFG
ncbi:hypothetical protein ACUNG1_08245 [Serratia sp. IR-2025]